MVNTEICYCVTSLNELKMKSGGGKLQLNSAEGRNVAKLVIRKVEGEHIPSFTDYIKAGW